MLSGHLLAGFCNYSLIERVVSMIYHSLIILMNEGILYRTKGQSVIDNFCPPLDCVLLILIVVKNELKNAIIFATLYAKYKIYYFELHDTFCSFQSLNS